ncbi:PolC-type DNA polymerase III [Flagellimonas eckloniae]|uniref:DNA polymerase III subunit epsilon n=1 Tax=Flagellimonas eckloniae TaxID=346185 RepID=A0A0N8WFQ0_9FLAO|nr:3'-5' exonuclease [Allomuricauda eckloniae]KQC29315.1 DNA polymerase III subunit epsilon [Allomuricauda eckloniae]
MRLFQKKKKDLPAFWIDYKNQFNSKLPVNINENEFVVFDTETTGFSFDKDRILSIGALKLINKNILVKESFEVYISQTHYNADSAEIHGILKKGKKECITEVEALKRFLLYIKNHVLVGHHVMFDVAMINQALKRNGLPKLKNQTLDTGLLYKRTLLTTSVLQKKEQYSLDDLAEKFSISRKDRHTALGDTYITVIAFLAILNKLKPKNLGDLINKQKPLKFGL